jgi:ElaB/YqjD/DUF883 family membrane-anchored ribosome-binding protein
MEHRDRIHSGSGVSGQSVGDWAASGARNVADVTRQRLDETKDTAKDYASAAKEYVQDAIQQTREHIEDTVQQAGDKMTDYCEGRLEKVKQDLAAYTREQPMTALLIAAGAGLVLGWMSAAARR